MKYQVQIKYTNPSHEHVTLRRRVDTITRIVEAANEEEAINRASRQQRSLGFLIKEANVVQSVSLNEGFDTDPKDIAAYLVDRHGKGKVTMGHIEAYERGRDSHRPIEKHEVMKHVKKMSEEVEQIDEMDKSQPSSSRGAEGLATGNKATPVTAKKTATDALKTLKKKINPVKEEVESVDEGIAADMLASKREKKQKAVRAKILDQELQAKKVARGKARQAGTMGHPAKADRYDRLKNEEKANVGNTKASKITLALNKLKAKKLINMEPTLVHNPNLEKHARSKNVKL